MRPVTVSVGPLTSASANNICTSQTPTTSFTINGSLASGGVATLDNPRRVLFTPAGNESANTFTVNGTAANGTPQTEVIAGTNATAFYTNLDFKTVTSITLASSAAGAITVGTNTIASTPWVRLDEYAQAQVSIQCVVTGTVNYTIQQTNQDPNSTFNPINPYSVVWSNTSDSAGVGATGTVMSYFAYAPLWCRVTLNSGTGTVNATFSQLGVAPY